MFSVSLGLVAGGCGRYELASFWNELRGDSYALDEIERDVTAGTPVTCPAEVAYQTYAGEQIKYSAPVSVATVFVPRLQAFERVVVELAREHYGRPPDRLIHFGARVCRAVRGSSSRLSEHALGNALDLAGFEWKRLPPAAARARSLAAGTGGRAGHGGAALAARKPEYDDKAFTVTVQKHWSSLAEADQAHRRFLHALVDRVITQDIFRGVIGPGREGHANHVHFDQAPWSYALF